MLIDALEICAATLSLVCMLATILCIVFGTKGSHAPTRISLAGCAFYVMFLALAQRNMDMSELLTYSSLLFAFALFVLTAEGIYRMAKKEKRVAYREKIADFKHNYSEALKGTRAIEAA